MSICRVCATRGNFCLPMDTKYEDLPISVVIQVICPIRILDSEVGLPKEVCVECYNIVLNAYKLREKSLITDKLLKEKIELPPKLDNNDQSSPQPVAHSSKRSRVDRESSETSQTSAKTDTTNISHKQVKKIRASCRPSTSQEPPHRRRGTNDSSSLGEFPDSTQRSEDHSSDEQKLLKQKKNEIINKLYEGLINPSLSISEDGSERKPLRCDEATCSNSHKLFQSENLLRVHKSFEHGTILDEPSGMTMYHVRPEVQSESYGKAFGTLCLRNGKVADAENLYCKLCISKGVMIKFNMTTEQTTLLDHVLSHLDAVDAAKKKSETEDKIVHPKQEKLESSLLQAVHDESPDHETSNFDDDEIVDLISDDESSLVDTEIAYQYASTKLGNLKIIIDGYSFAKKHDSASAQYYKCIKRVSK